MSVVERVVDDFGYFQGLNHIAQYFKENEEIE